MSWCPGPDCQNAVKANYHDALPVTCYCGYTFWLVVVVFLIKLLHFIEKSFGFIASQRKSLGSPLSEDKFYWMGLVTR